jgi:hypothetical protein
VCEEQDTCVKFHGPSGVVANSTLYFVPKKMKNKILYFTNYRGTHEFEIDGLDGGGGWSKGLGRPRPSSLIIIHITISPRCDVRLISKYKYRSYKSSSRYFWPIRGSDSMYNCFDVGSYSRFSRLRLRLSMLGRILSWRVFEI